MSRRAFNTLWTVPRSCIRTTLAAQSSLRPYSSAPASLIRFERLSAQHAGFIGVLSLNRPDARNALSIQLIKDLRDQIQRIRDEAIVDGIRALIIASTSNDAFCAGADLKQRKTMDLHERTREYLTDVHAAFLELEHLPIPTISAIGSYALGGGLELALCTTFRVMTSTATVGQPETRLGIIPGGGALYRLPAVIGLTRAKDLILTGRRLNGTEAHAMGLADRLVEVNNPSEARQRVLDASVEMARDITRGGPVASREALRALNNWNRGQAAETDSYETILRTEDRMEALRAFAEKRDPVFKGL